MPPKFVCMTDDFYSDSQTEAMEHLSTYADHDLVEVDRTDDGTIRTRLIKVESEKELKEGA